MVKGHISKQSPRIIEVYIDISDRKRGHQLVNLSTCYNQQKHKLTKGDDSSEARVVT